MSDKRTILLSLSALFVFLSSCTMPKENISLWTIKQIRDGRITLYDINKDNISDLIVSGYQKGGEIDYKKIMWIESDAKNFESYDGKWEGRGYSFYLDKNYQLWVRSNGGNAEKVSRNFFRSEVSAAMTSNGGLEILHNGKRQSTKNSQWKMAGLKIWVDDGQRLWVEEGDKKEIIAGGKWRRKLNVLVSPVDNWIRGTGYRRGGLVDKNNIPIGDSLVAINGKNQEIIWKYQTGGSLENYPTVYDDKVFVASSDKNLYAISLKNGKLLWKYPTFAKIETTVSVSENTVYFGNRDNYFYALDVSSGKPLWTFRAGAAIDSSPAIYDDKVFFGSWDKSFYALDKKSGRLIWKKSLPSYVGKSSPIIYDQKVIFGCWDKSVYALNTDNGKTEWIFRTDDWIDKASPAAARGLIFIGNKKGNFYAIKAASGVMKWQFNAADAITSAPALTEERVYLNSRDGSLYALSIYDGKLIWEHRTRFKIFSAPAVSQNKIFLSSMGGYLTAIADTAMGRPYWPMYGGDPSHRSNYSGAYNYSKDLLAEKTAVDKFLEENGFNEKLKWFSLRKYY